MRMCRPCGWHRLPWRAEQVVYCAEISGCREEWELNFTLTSLLIIYTNMDGGTFMYRVGKG